ncbi:MAG: hypothetical protein A3E36_00400 [Candidatus Andersenbacteria bacterium RIFCSPHIGHO2_12_FULL_45_11b]|uniref:Glycosyl transferase family 1 domain-containing protein n=1 Tax=Candidatus Andersenbacteria bacterium RIFCSPHIGHO2_12_FULL_45_11b TaxID=1797282 RepID=A0A1G1XCN7_9BACT|nr:MAG: hypothetical protein A3E36_00400 [Candidatus Andersenbacteria bacterium RIFCSPHIGHO2_12_FULL_45_11b]
MKIVFVTTQSHAQSTLIGRIIPIAKELGKKGNAVTVLVHGEDLSFPRKRESTSLTHGSPIKSGMTFRITGKNPFTRTATGKKRKSGLFLAVLLFANAIRSALAIIKIHPDVIIIVKPFPENVFAVSLARFFIPNSKIVLDVDDFELFANVLSSPIERAVLHWSERKASWLAMHTIAATPFLHDHMQAVSNQKNPITLIPTPYSPPAVLISNPSSYTLLYIGSVSQSSGHLVGMLPNILQEVRKEIPDTTLLIAGTGDDETMLKNRLEKLGLQDAVTWSGRFIDTDIPNIIAQSAVIIDPIDDSIVNRAKSSFRAMLAITAGMPIITSNIGIRPIIIPHQFHERFFVQAGDEQLYAQGIIRVLRNPLNNSEISVLHSASEKYSYEASAKMYYNCLV